VRNLTGALVRIVIENSLDVDRRSLKFIQVAGHQLLLLRSFSSECVENIFVNLRVKFLEDFLVQFLQLNFAVAILV
jgi:hypothetical protein